MLDAMIKHVRYELLHVINYQHLRNEAYLTIGPEKYIQLMTESLLEAALIHLRCLIEFLDEKAVYNDRRVAAGDYLPGWQWKIKDEVGKGVGQLHGRVAHLDIVRAPEAGFNWSPWFEREAPAVLQGFRDFMVQLRDHDERRYELFQVPDAGLPFVDVIAAIDDVLPSN